MQRTPSVFAWLFFQLFCAAAPAALIFLVKLGSHDPPGFTRLVGYSVILLIGLGIFLSTLSDILVSRGLNMDWQGTLTIAIGFALAAVSVVGSIADELVDRYEFLSFGQWLGFQVMVTIGTMIYCAMTKSSLDQAERLRRKVLEDELEALKKAAPKPNP